MNIVNTDFKALLIIEPKVLTDERGYFFESYNKKNFKELGITYEFVQDNQSQSTRGVLRGLHYQNAPFAQTKLIRVLRGSILDIVVDLRREQPTFGKYFSMELSDENRRQILIPRGFAHGFVVLSAHAEVLYKCDNFYHQPSEGGIIYNDPQISIDWRLDPNEIILSDKDKLHPTLTNAKFTF
jgi:dTDP-4-dehydrorhamnose 3,5-epimerase